MTLDEIANKLKGDPARITLMYAFNATGKTQLSVAYKNATKEEDGSHTGVYYNAYSEDLFVWDNDEENSGVDVRLTVLSSSLSKFHSSMTEDNVRDKLKAYAHRAPGHRSGHWQHTRPRTGLCVARLCRAAALALPFHAEA